MNITDYINTSRISDVIGDLQNYTFEHMMSEGIFGFGFSPFTDLMYGFFWSITFAVIGVSIWSWKGIYPTIGYFAALLLITAAILPTSFFTMIGIFLGLMITGILYKVFIGKGKRNKKAIQGAKKAIQGAKKAIREIQEEIPGGLL